MKYYAGIGSRKTPSDVIELMKKIGYTMAKNDYHLYSGGADGADSAFEVGCDKFIAENRPINSLKTIFLPWYRFNNHISDYYNPSSAAMNLAAEFHPAWNKLKDGAKKLHARNCYQVLGPSLGRPVDCVICWSTGNGGTEQALRIARRYEIKIYNLYSPKTLKQFMEKF